MYSTDWNDSTCRRQTKYSAFLFLTDKQKIRLRLQNFLREPMKVAEISGVLFASCSHAPKRGKKRDEFKSLHQNILKLLFCGHISLLQRKTTPLQIPPHMGKRNTIWRRSRIGSALVRVGQPHLLGMFGHGNIPIPPLRAQNYTTISLLTLCVKFDGIWRRTPELKHLPWTAFIRCIGNILFPIKAPFAKTMLFFWSLQFLSAFFHKISSNVSRNMLKIQTESYFHLTMSKWPISTVKL